MKQGATGVVFAVYDPPRPDLPFLAVMFATDGSVKARRFETGEEAGRFVAQMGTEAAVRFNSTPQLI